MSLDAIVTTGGALLLAAAAMRLALTAGLYTREGFKSATRQRRDIEAFRHEAQNLFDQLDPARKTASPTRRGKRPFRVVQRVAETMDKSVCSFYLQPVDRQPIPAYRPGQFLSLVIPTGSTDSDVRRCYSLSDTPLARQSTYRISVKRLRYPGTPPGRGSNYFHDQMFEGQIVDVLPPSGTFFLDQASNRPVVLVAGGVGITPLLSMLNWLVSANSQREIWLFHGARNRAAHAFQVHIAKLCHDHANIRCVTFYSRPTPACRCGIDFDVEGHVNVDVMKVLLKARDYEFYLCGPLAMMTSIRTGLGDWGVPAKDIAIEQFGSPAANADRHNGAGARAQHDDAEPVFQVEFLRSGKSVAWSARNGSLLELAEACGIDARCSCRAGQCGTCKVRLESGQIAYRAEPAMPLEIGTCLPCIAEPTSDLSVDM